MHPLRRQRLLLVIALVAIASTAVGLMVYALRENIDLFYPPAAIAAGEAPVGRSIRVGGMVREGSVQRRDGSLQVAFVLTDYQADVSVVYEGILPDMFAEGQGAVASGELDASGRFIADQVLAKHDENYMPPEVVEALGDVPAHNGGNKVSAPEYVTPSMPGVNGGGSYNHSDSNDDR